MQGENPIQPQISADERRYKRQELTETIGLLLNFGPRPQVRRFAFDNGGKKISGHLRKSAANGLA